MVCYCSACNSSRMPTSEALAALVEASRKVAIFLTLCLSKLGLAGWILKYVDWDDSSRLEGSCWGNNICDVRMKRWKDGKWVDMFVLGTENYNPAGVYVKMSMIECILHDEKAGGSRVSNLYEALNEAGTNWAHKGLDADVKLTCCGPEQMCFFKTQILVVPLDEGETADTAIFARNYQASKGRPRNAMLTCWGQGTDLVLDEPTHGGEARYCASEFDPITGKMRQFYTTTDVSSRDIEAAGTETAEEAVLAVADGKTAEVPLGPMGCKKSGSLMTVQIPIMQTKLMERKPTPAAMIAAAWANPLPLPAPGLPDSEPMQEDEKDEKDPSPKKQKPSRPPSPVSNSPVATVKLEVSAAEAPVSVSVATVCTATVCADDDAPPPEYRSLGSDEGEPVYRSTGGSIGGFEVGSMRDALPAVANRLPPHVNCKMGRFYKGDYIGEQAPLCGSNLVADPDGGIVTVVKTIVVTCPKGVNPTEEDLKQMVVLAYEDHEHAVKTCGGKGENLFSDLAQKLGHITKTITESAAQGIASTIKATVGSVPAGVF